MNTVLRTFWPASLTAWFKSQTYATFSGGNGVNVSRSIFDGVVFQPGVSKEPGFCFTHGAEVYRELVSGSPSDAPPLAKQRFDRRGSPLRLLSGITQKGGGAEAQLKTIFLHGKS